MQKRIGKYLYDTNEYGMLYQIDYVSFKYNSEYSLSQQTNDKMSYLRLGCLLGIIPYDELKSSVVLEIGPGNGKFMEVIGELVDNIYGFDITDTPFSTISSEEALSKQWDILCAFDVLEHFPDIEYLWKYNFDIGYFSIPCPPKDGIDEKWRHFKPNEHLWHITAEQFENWINAHGYDLIYSGCPEDIIRKRWNQLQVNINSFIIKRRF